MVDRRRAEAGALYLKGNNEIWIFGIMSETCTRESINACRFNEHNFKLDILNHTWA